VWRSGLSSNQARYDLICVDSAVKTQPTNPPPYTWFLGPTRLSIPNGISIGSAVFAGLTVLQTDRLTGRPTNRSRYSVSSNRPYLASAAMRPKNGALL